MRVDSTAIKDITMPKLTRMPDHDGKRRWRCIVSPVHAGNSVRASDCQKISDASTSGSWFQGQGNSGATATILGSPDAQEKAPLPGTKTAAERVSEQFRKETKAVILAQRIVRGYQGRWKSALALEIKHFSCPRHMTKAMLWNRRAVKGNAYMMVALLIVFSLYLNLIFGVKFDREQQYAWLEGFIFSLFMDLAIGIPVQICLMMVLPGEVKTACWAFVIMVLCAYIMNAFLSTEAVPMSWFEEYMGYFFIALS